MARPKVANPRDRQFNVGLTVDELNEVQQAARAAQMRPVDYGRAMLLQRRAALRLPIPDALPPLLAELRDVLRRALKP